MQKSLYSLSIMIFLLLTTMGFQSKAAELSKEVQMENIKKFAPKVYLHHDEKYYPGAVEDWFKAVEMRYLIQDDRKYIANMFVYRGGIKYLVWKGTEVTSDNIAHFVNETTGTTSGDDPNFYLARIDDGAMYGDNNGEINAPVYVKYYEGERYDEIQYLFWSPHNGNMGPKIIEKIVDGASHEGDWEGIVVLLSKENGQYAVDSVRYNAHHLEHEWFQASDVEFDGTHPIVYSGHDSHASFNLKSATLTKSDTKGQEWKIDRPRGTRPVLPDDHISNKGQVWFTWNNIEVLDIQPWLQYKGLWGNRSLDYRDSIYGPQVGTVSVLDSYRHKINFYARENAIGNLRATWDINGDGSYNLKQEPPAGRIKIPNDEVRSLKILKPDKGTMITLYRDAEGNRGEDFIEIRIKRDVEHYVIITNLETSYENEDVKVVYHGVKGLNGKVSRIEVMQE